MHSVQSSSYYTANLDLFIIIINKYNLYDFLKLSYKLVTSTNYTEEIECGQ